MSKILQPFGTLRRRIVIEADDRGMIRVDAKAYDPVVKRGFRPQMVETELDSRIMVLALQKVTMDYCAVLFNNPVPPGNEAGQKDNPNGTTTTGDSAA